jgi:hypothetical protein
MDTSFTASILEDQRVQREKKKTYQQKRKDLKQKQFKYSHAVKYLYDPAEQSI